MDKRVDPIAKKSRIEILDVFRGFAVFGIFVVNIEIMNCAFINQGTYSAQWTSDIDLITFRVLQLFFYTKFFPIFSLLFGIGLSMQALRLREKNTLSFTFFARRMFGLLILGMLHIIFLWSGDVLHLYALLGIFTTLLINKSPKWILLASIVILLFPFYEPAFGWIQQMSGFRPELYLEGYEGRVTTDIYREGTYSEGILLRLREYVSNIPLLFLFLGPIAASMFLLGLYLGKINFLNTIDQWMIRLKVPMITLAILTNLYRVLFIFYLPKLEIYRNEDLRPLLFKMMELSDMFMGLFYLWFIGWLWYFTKARKLLSPLKYVGRMALTNYIMHSAIGLVLFSALGFGWYESLSPSQTFVTAILVFGFQLIYSRLWLNYFQYGPLEWLWRCFTYHSILPIIKTQKLVR